MISVRSFFSGQIAKFALNRLRKSQHSDALQVLKWITVPSLNCPVCLKRYVLITKDFRNSSAPYSLILSLKSPHHLSAHLPSVAGSSYCYQRVLHLQLCTNWCLDTVSQHSSASFWILCLTDLPHDNSQYATPKPHHKPCSVLTASGPRSSPRKSLQRGAFGLSGVGPSRG